MMATVAEEIGQRVRRLRQEHGWSQETLAFLTDLNHATISRIEAGNRSPSRRTIRDLARAFGVTEAELRGE